MNRKNGLVLLVLAMVMVITSTGRCESGPTVLCFGDSITWGDRARGNCWVDNLSRRHLNYNFVNYGSCGRTTGDFDGFTKAVEEHGDSAIVFIFLGVNDLTRGTDEKVANCVKNISKMIDYVKGKIPQAEIVLLAPCGVNEKGMSPINIERGYADNAQVCLVKLSQEYEKVAAEKGVRFLSLLNVVSPENFDDGLHPNIAGQIQLGDYISKNIFMPRDDIAADLKDEGLTLVWNDEFEGDKINPNKWDICGDYPRRDGYWYKSESYVDGAGNLIIRTSKYGDKYISGAIETKGKFQRKGGYWVARCKFPTEQGHWPGFWIYSGAVCKVGNEGTDGTEIDIMEKPHFDQDSIAQTLHWDGYSEEHHKSEGYVYNQAGISKGWHIFGIYWTADEYVYYVDGKETWRTKAGGVSQVEEYIILSEEIAAFTGDISKATLPDYFTVDYVRVYDRP